jgi:hypothetical protein
MSIRPYNLVEVVVLLEPVVLVNPAPVVLAAIATPDVTGAFTVKD